MNRLIIIFTILTGFISCGQKNETTIIEDEEDSIKEECSSAMADEVNPNGASELALYMRHMEADLKEEREHLKNGTYQNLALNHEEILSAIPTKDGVNQEADYKSYASDYLVAVKELNSSQKEERIEKFNLVVEKCISCHYSYCGGPIGRIEKLKVNPDKIRLNKD